MLLKTTASSYKFGLLQIYLIAEKTNNTLMLPYNSNWNMYIMHAASIKLHVSKKNLNNVFKYHWDK